jgi:hypothetical protein
MVAHGTRSGSPSFALVTGIFLLRHIPPSVLCIFTGPLVPEMFEEALRVSLLWSQARKTRHTLVGPGERLRKAAAHAKDLATLWLTENPRSGEAITVRCAIRLWPRR